MSSRRAFLSQLGLLAVGGAAAWWLRDRLHWPQPSLVFAEGRSSGWLPFAERGQGVVIVDALVNGSAVKALLDSGAQSSVIDRRLAERLGVPMTALGPVVVAVGVSGAPQLGRAASLEVGLGGLTLKGLRTAVLDIAAVSLASGRAFEVILGQDMLKALVADIDFPGERVAFHAPDAIPLPQGARPISVRTKGRELLVPVTVDSIPLEVVFDTGASGALALSAETAEAAGLLSGRPIDRAPSITLGGASLDRVIPVETLSFAGETLRGVRVHVYTPHQGAPLPKGLLGVEAFDRYRVILDLGRGRLHFAPAGAPRRRRRRQAGVGSG